MPARLFFILALSITPSFASAAPVDYLRDVKPILTVRCYACHGALLQKAKLRVDTARAMLDAEVIVPGKSSESLILLHIQEVGGLSRMPPPAEGEALTADQISTLKRWIDEGAVLPPTEKPDPDPREHWSFRSPQRAPVPRIPSQPSTNPIDAFLAAKWAEQGLTPQPRAEKRLLLRRVSLDLIGLPPTEAEYDAFLSDPSPEAYANVVKRLLASPHYGERWGRHFLDIWRYSDWWGLAQEVRSSQKHMWHWRDWTIESLNADLGYDEMIREMLAADELYPTDPKKLRATGFLARQYFRFNRTTWLDEVIEHTGKAFLGLTFNCAKCHDHKFDPITADDYYRYRAIFEPYQVRMDMVPGEPNFEKDGIPRAFDCNLDAPTYKHERGDDRRPLTGRKLEPGLPRLLTWEEYKPVPVSLPLTAHKPAARPEIIAAFRTATEQKVQETIALRNQVLPHAPTGWIGRAVQARLNAAVVAAEKGVSAIDEAAKNPSTAKFPFQGALKTPESNVESAESRMKPFPKISTGRRSALANWMTDERNPLTARVVVNHVWMRHFGRPLVPTIFDFGRRGTKPSHPELLDWLAVEFMERGWSFKHLHHLIVTSSAYCMSSSSKGGETNVKRDEENKYLWRQNSVRMEAQLVRDSLLQLADRLDPTLGGASIPPKQQDSSTRRSVYFFQSHNVHHKFLSQFDDANVLECYRRTESIVPQQALTLANSRFALSMAEALTNKLQKQHPKATDAEFVTIAFELILATAPTQEEQAACLAALEAWRGAGAGERSRMQLVSALLNHNDFVTVR